MTAMIYVMGAQSRNKEFLSFLNKEKYRHFFHFGATTDLIVSLDVSNTPVKM